MVDARQIAAVFRITLNLIYLERLLFLLDISIFLRDLVAVGLTRFFLSEACVRSFAVRELHGHGISQRGVFVAPYVRCGFLVKRTGKPRTSYCKGA